MQARFHDNVLKEAEEYMKVPYLKTKRFKLWMH